MHLVASGRMKAEPEPRAFQRVVEWIVDLAGGAWLGRSHVKARRLRVVETLPLGAKKQLLLVTCDGEKYLVGTGAESVQTITRVERRAVTGGPGILMPEQGESK